MTLCYRTTRSLARLRLAPFVTIIIVLRNSHQKPTTINRPNDDTFTVAPAFTIRLAVTVDNYVRTYYVLVAAER